MPLFHFLMIKNPKNEIQQKLYSKNKHWSMFELVRLRVFSSNPRAKAELARRDPVGLILMFRFLFWKEIFQECTKQLARLIFKTIFWSIKRSILLIEPSIKSDF